MTTALIDVARQLEDEGVITGWDYVPDDCGYLSLIRLDFDDETYAIAGIESDINGNAEGYTWTLYDGSLVDAPHAMITTDGGTDFTQFASDMRTQAQLPRQIL